MAFVPDALGAASFVTLCPPFLEAKTDDERARVMIHEASHATDITEAGSGVVPAGTDDISTANQRPFEFLSTDQALKNADSYALYALKVSGGTIEREKPPQDTSRGLSADEVTGIRHGIALLQGRLVKARFSIRDLYETINTSRPPAKAWTSTQAEARMVVVAPLFGLTLPPLLPTMRDQVAMAGILDRIEHMVSPLFSPLDLRRSIKAATEWSNGPGQDVQIGTDYLLLGLKSPGPLHVRVLHQALANATPEITAAQRPAFVQTAEAIEKLP